MNSPSPPTPPDPVKTANGQTSTNINSGIVSNMNNMTNQVTPEGNLTYSRTGEQTYTGVDAGGKPVTYKIPQFTATQTYSPEQQALYDTANKTKAQIGQIGLDQSRKMGDLLNTPIDLSDTSIDKHLYDLYSPRVQQQQALAGQSLDAKLAAQGVTADSDAYKNAYRLQNEGNNDQWNQLYLNGHNTAIQQMTQQRQEPINELNALMSGSQVSNPTYGQTPNTTINPADYQGAVADNFNGQMQIYNSKVASNNAMMGGIFGTIGAIGGGWARSDRRVKTDIVRIGTLPNSLPVYSYRFKDGGPMEVGLMADEVALLHPHAVANIGGVDHVNYHEAVK